MKKTSARILIFICGFVSLVPIGRADQLRAVDYRATGRYEERRGDSWRGRRLVLPPRVRIQATTRHDRELARLYTQQLFSQGPVEPNGPPVNVRINYGRIRIAGRIEDTGEHHQFVDAARSLRGAGVVDVQDELRTGPPYRY